MRKTLLLLISVTFAQISSGQTFFSDNFSTYTVGNIGTDLTGVTPGQGMFYTSATNGATPTTTTNTDNSNFQIVPAGGDNGQALQITGPNGDKGNRFMWQEGLDMAWAARTAGNDIIEMEFDLYTGDPTTSKNTVRVYIYDATKTKILAGFYFDTGTKALSGVAYYDASAQPGGQVTNYLFFLGVPNTSTTPPTQTNVVFPANTWQRIGVSYNYNNGQVIWRGPTFNPSINIMGAAPTTNPDEIDLIMVSGSNASAVPPVVNTAAATVFFDNIVARASATDTLLGVSQVSPVAEFSMFPNPVNDVLNISNNAMIKSYQITDLNGRIIRNASVNNSEASVNVSDLASGMYILNVTAENGTIVKKIMKN
ncbi:MAG TPA: T9SS type A sorting domain-containing protein [Flavobacterium sp.]